MAEEEEVIKISLQGMEEIIAAFGKIAKAAQDAGNDISKGFSKPNAAIQKVEQAQKSFVGSFRNIGSAASNFGSSIGRVGTQAAKYFTILTGGIALFQRYSAAQNQSDADTKVAIKQVQQNSQANIQYRQTVEANARAVDDLARSQQQQNSDASEAVRDQVTDLESALSKGKISQQQFAEQSAEIEEKAARDRSKRFREQIREMAELRRKQEEELRAQQQAALARSAEEEERIRLTARIQQQAKAEAAYAANVKAFGSETAQGIDQFARAFDQLMDKLNQGPSLIGDVLKAAAQFINENGTEIVETLNKIGDAFGKALFGDGAGDVTSMSETIMKAFRGVSEFILNTLIPGFKSFIGVLDTVAEAINGIFGTNFSGAGLAAIIVIGSMIGAFRLLATVIGTVAAAFRVLYAILLASGFTPVGAAIRIVIIVIGLLVAALATLKWQEIVDAASKAVNSIVEFFKNLKDSVVNYFADLWNRVVSDTQQSWQQLLDFLNQAWESIKQAAYDAGQAIYKAMINAVPGLKTVVDWVGRAIEGFKKLAQAKSDAGGEGADVTAAAGGPIFGRGTGTSDSIIARLSNGEYVVRAAAVRKYGLRMLNQINGMRYRGFAKGGFVSNMFNPLDVPRYAGGGVAEAASSANVGNSLRPVIFQFPDGSEFAAEMETNTADRLGRYAAKRRVSSNGRKPTYYGGGR